MKKIITPAKALLAMAVMSSTFALMIACKDDDSNEEPIPDAGYVVAFRTATDPTADYLVATGDLKSGTIDAVGKGTELEDWSFYGKAGDTYLVFNYGENAHILHGYKLKDKELVESGQTVVEADMLVKGKDKTAVLVNRTGGEGTFKFKVSVVNDSVAVIKSSDVPFYEKYIDGKRQEAWPTGAYVQGDKFYLSYYFLDYETFEPTTTDTAYVSVYSYPGLQYLSTFKDGRTGPVGSYGMANGMIEDENGNHYAISNSGLSIGYKTRTKNAAILKINNGASQFASDYYFDTEAQGYRVLQAVYAGNGKMVARVVSVATDNSAEPWAAFGSDWEKFVCRIAVLDMNTKTVTLVNEIPLHKGQYQFPSLVDNSKVSLSIATALDGVFVYEVDPATAKATKGARINGQEIQAFYKY